MDHGRQFSCILIGADTLLIECGELLLGNGHRVDAVVTRTPRIAQWAQNKDITVIDLDDDYPTSLAALSFDLLFSITHLEIIPDAVLQMPSRMAINFHDGPLPRYAGINTPAWALLKRETEYGISWHEMVADVDKGELLKQQMFAIGPDETSLSINTQCFAAALESFPLLLKELETDSLTPLQQNLADRSYFGKFKRPDNGAIINWQNSAQDIEALVRAMDFGDYPNPIASPKLLFSGQPYIVTRAKAGEEQSDCVAGTVLSFEESGIKVATGDGVINLNQFRHLNGKVISAGELANQLQLAKGMQFDSLDQPLLQQLDAINSQLCRREEYWLGKLADLKPVEIPYASSETANPEQAARIDLQLSADQALAISAFSVLLARLNQKFDFDLSYSDQSLRQQAQGLESLVSSSAVLSVNIDSTASGEQSITTVREQLDTLAKGGSWLHDLIARQPTLRAIPELSSGQLLPVGIEVCDNCKDFSALTPQLLTLVLSNTTADCQLVYDEQRISLAAIEQLKTQLMLIMESLAATPAQGVTDIPLISDVMREQLLVTWNQTTTDYDNSQCIHQLFEQQVASHPNKTALVFEDHTLSYQQLNDRANQLAAYLLDCGVGPDVMVGVNIERSLELMVATLGVLKAGAAYVPLDPAFPADRLGYMIEDAGMPVILTQQSLADQLHTNDAKVVCIDSDWPGIAEFPATAVAANSTATNLAYVIYTSGSTGKPKGVMVEHRNAVNFFVGMDDRIPFDDNSCWLAVTSLSFDISVLELFWTLTRGLKVVIYKDTDKVTTGAPSDSRPIDFGLFMWGNDDAPGSSKYRLMIEGAKYFDENGFNAVWTPERHFHAFGGPYPNPAVTSAAIAAVTKNVHIRSGSIVSPLHHPIRIAEDWAIVDNLSDGRVGLSFAAGWQPNDFVIKPENHGNNKAVMLEQIDQVKKLWRGESIAFENPMGKMVDVVTLPRPVQKELPVWLTTAGNPDSYRAAGAKGVNVLTHLLGQSVEELAEKVQIYRAARKEAGFDPATGKVSLMLHTFVGDDMDTVRELVREPMKDYLRSSMKLVIDFAWAFPAFKRPGGEESTPDDVDIKSLSEEESETILDFAFERYFETSGMFGTPDICQQMVNRCKGAGIDEIACLLDFGVETDLIMDSLPLLKQVRDMATPADPMMTDQSADDQSFAAQVERHKVTHFQCTPSHARMLTFSDEAHTAMASLKHMMVGGEAFPASLAKELKGILNGSLTNMYGPTETTIWSTTQQIDDADDITIGRPIANTGIYILDANKNPVPIGVPGDLYIGGDGVVRGYLHRPELTDERFIANPFSRQSGQRIYWTGDMAKYREDGVIEFLGRVDHQVKVRGYRIELGEIEAQIGQYPGVRENVLLLREDTPGDQRLVSYLMQSSAIEIAALKEQLRSVLPDYMVPSDYVVLDAFPLTPNGKIDRNSLPSPQSMQQQTVTEYVAPEDELEQTIATLWQDTLKIDQVGINDNFFDLGGHSLLIVRIHSQLKSMIEQPVSLTDLYGYPTIGSLSQFLKSGGSAATLQKSSDRAQRRRQMMGKRRR